MSLPQSLRVGTRRSGLAAEQVRDSGGEPWCLVPTASSGDLIARICACIRVLFCSCVYKCVVVMRGYVWLRACISTLTTFLSASTIANVLPLLLSSRQPFPRQHDRHREASRNLSRSSVLHHHCTMVTRAIIGGLRWGVVGVVGVGGGKGGTGTRRGAGEQGAYWTKFCVYRELCGNKWLTIGKYISWI